jgi:hypothetical protein
MTFEAENLLSRSIAIIHHFRTPVLHCTQPKNGAHEFIGNTVKHPKFQGF